MSFHVYILRCSDASYYTGHTDNMEKRIAEHERGGLSVYTRKRRPLKLVYAEEFASRIDAAGAGTPAQGIVTLEEGGVDQGQLGAATPSESLSVLGT